MENSAFFCYTAIDTAFTNPFIAHYIQENFYEVDIFRQPGQSQPMVPPPFINESRYGGILYLALWLVVLGLVFTLFQTIFLSIAYTGRLTPDDYEVLHVEQTEYDQSIGAYDSGIIRRFSDYLVTVQYEVDGTRYTADLSLGQAFFTGNRVARAGADGSSVLGTIFYKSSDP